MNAFSYLVFPNPTATEFVAVPTLCEQDITILKPKSFDVFLGCVDFLHLRDVKMATLNICNTQIWYAPRSWIPPALVNGDPTFEGGNGIQSGPRPSLRECGQTRCVGQWWFEVLPLSPAGGLLFPCGAALVQRPDDAAEVVRTRIAVYLRETAPLKDYYRRKSVYRPVDARGTIDEIARAIALVLDPKTAGRTPA